MQYPIAVIHLYPDRNIIAINNVRQLTMLVIKWKVFNWSDKTNFRTQKFWFFIMKKSYLHFKTIQTHPGALGITKRKTKY